MGTKSSKWRFVAGLLLDQGLMLLVPYVRILANPVVKWALRLIIGKLLDKHLGRVEEVKKVLDEVKVAPEVLEKRAAKLKATEKMRQFVRRQPF